ncbi:MAG: hypothetical protein GXY77_07675 [Fibrobacter sp.]|nr:hypothetical protein [Fibrobacter sp.]
MIFNIERKNQQRSKILKPHKQKRGMVMEKYIEGNREAWNIASQYHFKTMGENIHMTWVAGMFI